MAKADPEKLVSFIVSSIVDKKEKFSLKRMDEDDFIKLEIEVAKEDMGKVIGKGGTTIWAIRRLAGLAGVALRKKVVVTLSE